MHAADFSLTHHFAREPIRRGGAALRAGLIDGAEPAAGFHQLATFLNGEADGFLAIDVLAGVRGEHGGRGVPAVAGGDEHRVNVLSREQIAKVRESDAIRVAVVCVHLLLADPPASARASLTAAKLDFREGEKIRQGVAGAVADADAAKDDAVARRDGAVEAEDRAGHDERGGGGAQGGEKTSAIQTGNAHCVHNKTGVRESNHGGV